MESAGGWWINDFLLSARRIYEAVGFSIVKEDQQHRFGHDLTFQFWQRDL